MGYFGRGEVVFRCKFISRRSRSEVMIRCVLFIYLVYGVLIGIFYMGIKKRGE